MENIDDRLLRVSFQVGGVTRVYENLTISVQGEKFGSPNQGQCIISITNLSKDVNDQLITESSPFNGNTEEKTITVEAGRKSTGLSLVYTGNIFRATDSQPPDRVTRLRCVTGQYQKGQMVAASLGGNASLSSIATFIATSLGVQLQFEAQNKSIANFSYSGPALKLIDKLDALGGLDVFLDGQVLVVKDMNVPLSDQVTVIGSEDIIGKPELTEYGVKLSYLYDNQSTLGGKLELTSKQYPNTSGSYVIYKLLFNISNRDTPFYYTAEASRL